jgi:hypothetical protein
VRELMVVDQNSMLAMIGELAKSPDVSIEKMRAVLDMRKEVFEIQSKIEFNQAMTRVQSLIKSITKNKNNSQTKSTYADLDSVLEEIRPIYTDGGFCLSFNQEDSDKVPSGWFRTTCEVSHIGGYSKTYFIDLPLDNKGAQGNVNKTEVHGMASSRAYAKRYLQSDIFNLTFKDADKDGNKAPSKTISPGQAKTLEAIFNRLSEANQETFYGWLGEPKDVPSHMFNDAQAWLLGAEKTEKEAGNA